MKLSKQNRIDLNKATDAINNTIITNSNNLSKELRYVFFAIQAFVWGLLIKDKPLIKLDGLLITFFILMAIYYTLDLLQYGIVLVKYHSHAKTFNYVFTKTDKNSIKSILNDEKIERSKINNLSYIFFYSKIVIIISAIVIFTIIISRAIS